MSRPRAHVSVGGASACLPTGRPRQVGAGRYPRAALSAGVANPESARQGRLALPSCPESARQGRLALPSVPETARQGRRALPLGQPPSKCREVGRIVLDEPSPSSRLRRWGGRTREPLGTELCPPTAPNQQAKREGRVAGPMNLISFVTALQPFVDEVTGRIAVMRKR
jgi:hypothetical protein